MGLDKAMCFSDVKRQPLKRNIMNLEIIQAIKIDNGIKVELKTEEKEYMKVGVIDMEELTSSEWAVLNFNNAENIAKKAIQRIGEDKFFNACYTDVVEPSCYAC